MTDKKIEQEALSEDELAMYVMIDLWNLNQSITKHGVEQAVKELKGMIPYYKDPWFFFLTAFAIEEQNDTEWIHNTADFVKAFAFVGYCDENLAGFNNMLDKKAKEFGFEVVD